MAMLLFMVHFIRLCQVSYVFQYFLYWSPKVGIQYVNTVFFQCLVPDPIPKLQNDLLY
jgi:hypothetical protein